MPSANPPDRVVVVDSAAPPDVTLHRWPLRDEPVTAACTLLCAAVFSLVAGIFAASVLFGLASTIALAIALRAWWLPTELHMNHLGVKVTMHGRSRRIMWSEISDYELRPAGAMLWMNSPARPYGLPHGLYIPYLVQRTEIIAMIEYYVKQRMVRQPNANS